jgi:hypothetical protein
MKCIVVNCSKGYSLGSRKLYNWLLEQGNEVSYTDTDPGMFLTDFDLVCLSVVFSWDVKKARDIALRVRGNSDMWAGGPGFAALKNWWKKETGLECTYRVDERFEHQRGNYERTFASRGCPIGCSFCNVRLIEGKEFVFNYDFQPAPMLGDNNISALPVDFQEHIVKRYLESGIKLKDAESGFEPRSFDDDTYYRWLPIMKNVVWRFGFDETNESEYVERMMKILLKEPRPSHKKAFVLIGNEPMEMCYKRIIKTIEWGGEPFAKPVIALNALDRKPMINYDWTERKLMDMTQWANRWYWRKTPLKEYLSLKNQGPTFANETWLK